MHVIEQDVILKRAQRAANASPQPFLRWAGAKRRLLPQIVPHLPERFGRYIEPFLGAGALFFLLQPRSAYLSDTNTELINTWAQIAKSPVHVHRAATARPLAKDEYYAARASTPIDLAERAGQFIYLNRGAFNGLYRVNRSGIFNTGMVHRLWRRFLHKIWH